VLSLVDGQPLAEDWPALINGARPHEDTLDLGSLKTRWNGEDRDETAAAVICGTIAIALRAMGRAASVGEAEGMAQALWRDRVRTSIPGAA